MWRYKVQGIESRKHFSLKRSSRFWKRALGKACTEPVPLTILLHALTTTGGISSASLSCAGGAGRTVSVRKKSWRSSEKADNTETERSTETKRIWDTGYCHRCDRDSSRIQLLEGSRNQNRICASAAGHSPGFFTNGSERSFIRIQGSEGKNLGCRLYLYAMRRTWPGDEQSLC